MVKLTKIYSQNLHRGNGQIYKDVQPFTPLKWSNLQRFTAIYSEVMVKITFSQGANTAITSFDQGVKSLQRSILNTFTFEENMVVNVCNSL